MRTARHIAVEDVNKQNLTGKRVTFYCLWLKLILDVTQASSSALPPSLDVDKFVNARSFELEALEKSMLNAK